jgi:hypothetical protein
MRDAVVHEARRAGASSSPSMSVIRTRTPGIAVTGSTSAASLGRCTCCGGATRETSGPSRRTYGAIRQATIRHGSRTTSLERTCLCGASTPNTSRDVSREPGIPRMHNERHDDEDVPPERAGTAAKLSP